MCRPTGLSVQLSFWRRQVFVKAHAAMQHIDSARNKTMSTSELTGNVTHLSLSSRTGSAPVHVAVARLRRIIGPVPTTVMRRAVLAVSGALLAVKVSLQEVNRSLMLDFPDVPIASQWSSEQTACPAGLFFFFSKIKCSVSHWCLRGKTCPARDRPLSLPVSPC